MLLYTIKKHPGESWSVTSYKKTWEILTEGAGKAKNWIVSDTFEDINNLSYPYTFEKYNYVSGLFAWGGELIEIQPISHIFVK